MTLPGSGLTELTHGTFWILSSPLPDPRQNAYLSAECYIAQTLGQFQTKIGPGTVRAMEEVKAEG